MKKIYLLFLFSIASYSFAQTGWLHVTGFGSNPGNLNMYQYVPDSISPSAPLVLVLHGCSQTAQSFANESGWNLLANKHKFYVVYAEQQYV